MGKSKKREKTFYDDTFVSNAFDDPTDDLKFFKEQQRRERRKNRTRDRDDYDYGFDDSWDD